MSSGAYGPASERLPHLIRQAGLADLTPDALNRFDRYLELLLKWNSRLNLTAIREPEMILRRHFIECIQCAQTLPQRTGLSLLDFGSGAGLPGIPIAICRPDIRVTLGESREKKAAFLSEAVRTLGISAEVFGGRVEDMPGDRRFDVVTLRAVDRMSRACEVACSRLKSSGWIVVFVTKETKTGLMHALPSIRWLHDIPSAGLSKGSLLVGQQSPEEV